MSKILIIITIILTIVALAMAIYSFTRYNGIQPTNAQEVETHNTYQTLFIVSLVAFFMLSLISGVGIMSLQ